jgi:NADPH-dependent 2,4-dienoyl-CoA reductase/sulfur reductase-like enzyme
VSPDYYDAVIVGGGPAGLAASLDLAQAGARVLIIEEQRELGGQYFKQRHSQILKQYGQFRPAGARLIQSVMAAGVACLTGHLVWGAQDDELWISRLDSGHVSRVGGRLILVATGAYEKTIPFPGWTLPGVCTPGCALHFAAVDRVRVGQRVLVAGGGPFLLPVACSLIEVGAIVVGVLEAAHPYRISMTTLNASTHVKRMRELTQYLTTLVRNRVQIRQGWRVSEAFGNGRVERVRFSSKRDQTEEAPVDALCVAYGFSPSTELLRLFGVECNRDPVSGEPVPVIDDYGRTSRPGVYVAGEAAGIGGVDAALNGGRLAGIAMAADLGLRPASGEAGVGGLLRRQARLRKFALLTARLYAFDGDYGAVADSTIVCRCECVTAGSVRRAALNRWSDLQAVKGLTRAGMGPCQGRECGATVARLVADVTGSEIETFPARMPIKPIRILQEEAKEAFPVVVAQS